MTDKYLSIYYFHGQDLCIVPRHVKEDVQWMVDQGVDGVFVGVHDSDLMGGNTALVCETIRDVGLDLWLIPSRLGGLMAGWGRQISHLAVKHLDWCGLNADGTPRRSFGPQFSVFHPDVPAAIAETTAEMLKQFPATGIVWDELKTLQGEDHSEHAKQALGRSANEQDMVDGTVACFSKINQILKADHPDVLISCFLYADMKQPYLEAAATIDLLDEFGCDGKCHRPDEADVGEGGPRKVLLGGYDNRFATAAKANNCTPFTLLETQLLDAPTLDLSLERLPEFLAEKEGHLAYYYYPCGLENPEHYMPKFGDAIKKWRHD